MRRLVPLCALVATLAATACETVSTEAISGARYRAILAGSNQMPAVQTVATGTADLVVVNDTSLAYRITASGLGPVTQVHVHEGAAGVNGRITVLLFSSDSATATPTPTPTAAGAMELSGRITPSMVIAGGSTGRAVMDTLQRLMASGRAYINVHSARALDGELRGQIVRLP